MAVVVGIRPLVCVFFVYLPGALGGGGHNPYSNTYIVVGWGGEGG